MHPIIVTLSFIYGWGDICTCHFHWEIVLESFMLFGCYKNLGTLVGEIAHTFSG